MTTTYEKFNILLLGEPAAGKTNLMAMLDAIWTIDPNPIIERKTQIRDALNNNPLLQGYIAEPTSKDYDTSIWKVKYNNQEFELSLPEYKGEEFDQLRHSLLTEWSDEWQDRLQVTQGIILIIPSTNDPARDLLTPPSYSQDLLNDSINIEEKNSFYESNYELFKSKDLSYVHFLQSLLILRNISRKKKKQIPLWIFLTQWDLQYSTEDIDIQDSELPTPKDHLNKILPWLYSYINNNWHSDFLKVYGISALGNHGKNLLSQTTTSTNENFQTVRKLFMQAPHAQGWAIDNRKEVLNLQQPFADLLDVLKKE